MQGIHVEQPSQLCASCRAWPSSVGLRMRYTRQDNSPTLSSYKGSSPSQICCESEGICSLLTTMTSVRPGDRGTAGTVVDLQIVCNLGEAHLEGQWHRYFAEVGASGLSGSSDFFQGPLPFSAFTHLRQFPCHSSDTLCLTAWPSDTSGCSACCKARASQRLHGGANE